MANNSNSNSSACNKSLGMPSMVVPGPSSVQPLHLRVPRQYPERKVIKKSDWRVWQNRALTAEKENEQLKLKIERTKTSPTHIWKRIKVYWFGDEYYMGKISTLRIFKSPNGNNTYTTFWIHNTSMYYKSVCIHKYDGGDEKSVYFHIRIPFTKYLIVYSNRDKKFRIKKWEEDPGSDACCAG